MKEIIYYADLTPCDDLHNYKEAAYIPKFIEEDTKHFDTKPPLEVVQLATRLGWCIVAKWYNNGSTRIYAKNEGAVRNGVKILRGICGSCNCDYAFVNDVVCSKEIIEKDIYVFDGHTLGNDKEFMKQYMEEVDETVAIHTTKNLSDEDMYRSLLDNLFETYKAKNSDYGNAFAEMFDELGIDYAYGKLREKMNRIKTLRNQPNMVENEGLEDALLDTAGYAILTLVELKKKDNGKSE